VDKLNRVRDGWYEYQRMNERVERLEALAEKTTVSLSGMPRGGSDGSTAGDVWAMLIDCRDECARSIKQYLKDCKDLEQELLCIKSPRIRTAMMYRYIDCLDIEQIAERMECEERTVYYHIKKGRRIYEQTYEN